MSRSHPAEARPSGKAHGEEGESSEGHDSGAHAASQLVPELRDIPFLQPVLIAVAGLFIAAIVLGIPALKLKSPEPPDPAASDHGHDDHAAHDAHGHAAPAHDSHAKH
ncbi:MAG: hypothetical protein K8S99_10275 [Planctomycetes bacterium]|nr:hypothetical protein [Planctomycetota bacterium]